MASLRQPFSGSELLVTGQFYARKQIGEELGVRYLVQGVVRWAKDAAGTWRAQVTPALVNTTSRIAEWTGPSVVITPDDPFTAQGAIASDVAKALQIELAPAAQAGRTRRFTDNPQAFAAYQRGRTIVANLSRNSDRYSRIAFDEDTTGVAALLDRVVRNAPNDADMLATVSSFYEIYGKERSFALSKQAAILDPRSSLS